MLDFAIQCARGAGDLLRQHFGHVRDIRVKDSRSSIVTEADLAVDRWITDALGKRYPDHNLLTEESGFLERGSPYTWVVDPLDGTSNFAAGIPWFGVMIALLERGVPTLGVMCLPCDDVCYVAARGRGTARNGQPLRLGGDADLAQVLCGFGLDAAAAPALVELQAAALVRLAQEVRNIRATNSLVDFALTLDGRLGVCVNFHTKIWDIAAPWLIFQEAGGAMTGLRGEPLSFSLGPDACDRSYGIAAGPARLHAALIRGLSWPGP